MGSFNLQCAISGETIGPEDEVVSFFVEPVLNKDGMVKVGGHFEKGENQYVISSLPVYGRYGDYGRVVRLGINEEPMGNQLATEVSKALYDYDYSENDVENYYDNFSKGGGKSFLETNTLHKVIKIESYNAIWSEVKDKDLAELLEQGRIEDAFEGNIDSDLLEHLKNLNEINPVEFVGAAQLVRAFKELNIDLGLKVKIASQFSMKDMKLRKSMHNALENINSGNSGSGSAFKYTCMVSGNALASGDKAYVIPLVSKYSLESNIGIVNERNVCGYYEISASPIEAVIDENGDVKATNISDRQFSWVVAGTDDEVDVTKDNLFEKIRAGEINNVSWGNIYHSNFAIISEDSYKALGIKEGNLLKEEYKIVESAAKLFDSAVELIEKEPVKAREIFENSDLFPRKDAIDIFFETLEEDILDPKREGYRNSDVGRAFKNAYYSIASIKGDRRYDNNILMDYTRPDNDHSFIFSLMRRHVNKTIMSNETGKMEDAVKILGAISDEMQKSFDLICRLDRFGIGLMPAKEYIGTLAVKEQKKLNRDVREPSIQASLKTLREHEEEYSL